MHASLYIDPYDSQLFSETFFGGMSWQDPPPPDLSPNDRMRAFRDYFLGYVLPQVVLEHLEMEHNICVGDPTPTESQYEYSYMGTYKKVLSDVVTHHPDNFYVFAGGQKTFPPEPAMELNFVPIYPGKPSGALKQDEDDDEDEEGRKPILGGASDE